MNLPGVFGSVRVDYVTICTSDIMGTLSKLIFVGRKGEEEKNKEINYYEFQ